MKRIFTKNAQTDQNFTLDQISAPPEQPVVPPPPTQPPVQQPDQGEIMSPPGPVPQDTQNVVQTGLNKSKRLGTWWFAILEPVPEGVAEVLVSQYGYRHNPKFRPPQFNKQVTEDSLAQVKSELGELQATFNFGIDNTGIAKAEEVFATVDPGQVEGITDINDITNLNIDEAKIRELSSEFVKKKLGELAKSTDEAAKQGFISEFLAFSSKLHKYSFMNQILMWLQNKDTTLPAGAKNWEKKFGRKVREGEKPMAIFAPATKSNYVFMGLAQKLLQAMQGYAASNPGDALKLNSGEKVNRFLNSVGASKFPAQGFVKSLIYTKGGDTVGGVISNLTGKIEDSNASGGSRVYYNTMIPNRFKIVDVYDISQTDPIPGAEKVFEPISRDVWQSSRNTEDETTTVLTEAALKFAESKGIKVDIGADTGRAGGWSRGTEIAIDKMSGGLRRFSVIVHELAHSLLHFGEDKEKGVSYQQGEIQAESTDFVVLQHFGFDEPAFSSNYLALWQSRGEEGDIMKSYTQISKAAGQIIDGINKYLPKGKKAFHCNWFKKFAQHNYLVDIEEFFEITSI